MQEAHICPVGPHTCQLNVVQDKIPNLYILSTLRVSSDIQGYGNIGIKLVLNE
jgi:hypothetical protein